MKRFSIIAIMVMICFCGACGKKEVENEISPIEPQIMQMRSICNLATLECYYRNVAKYMEEDATGVLFWKKDKQFWMEYSGIITLGIDASKVSMEVEGDQVTIYIPPAQIFGCKVDENSLSEDTVFVAKKSADVTAEDQIEAFANAQENMFQVASNDKTLLASAQQRAQRLLEDYVNNIGRSVGKTYKINWVYLDENGEVDEKVKSNDDIDSLE